jgi:hypothetical protein
LRLLFIAAVSLGVSAASADEFVDLIADPKLADWAREGDHEVSRDGEKKPIWRVEDKTLICEGYGYGFLRYDKKLCDFVVELEYRHRKGGNSGIGLRATEYTGLGTQPSFSGYEIQLIDDHGQQPGDHSTASLYRFVAPTSLPVKPAEEWNEISIECVGPKIRIVLNGETVQDVDQSKIDSIKDKPLCGFLSLQNHGDYFEFRNVRLKELTAK